MNELLIAVLGLAAGLLGGYLLARRRLQRELDAAREQVHASQVEVAGLQAEARAREGAFAEQKRLLQESEKKLENAFGNLASQALRTNNAVFLQQADEKLKPLKETLGKLEQRSNEIERAREKAYGTLETHLGRLAEQTEHLRASSQSLATALRGSSQARGRWGEMALRNIADLAGMTRHCDFSEQTVLDGGGRPDMVVKLPGGGQIPVDAKAPLAAYDQGTREEDPDLRKAHFRQHAADLRDHILRLAKRDYTAGTQGSIDFTVLFLPAEPLLSTAFEVNPALQDEALRNHVLIATPVTLVALLRTVGTYWEQQDIAENAKAVWDEARVLYERVTKFQEHLFKVGKGLQTASQAYESAVSSFQKRVVPSGRKLEQLQVPQQGRRRLEDPPAAETGPHESTLRELGAGEEA